MAVKIKLKRIGKIHAPQYRIVVADARTARDGRAIEEIGIYQPMNDPSIIKVNSERAQYWLGVKRPKLDTAVEAPKSDAAEAVVAEAVVAAEVVEAVDAVEAVEAVEVAEAVAAEAAVAEAVLAEDVAEPTDAA